MCTDLFVPPDISWSRLVLWVYLCASGSFSCFVVVLVTDSVVQVGFRFVEGVRRRVRSMVSPGVVDVFGFWGGLLWLVLGCLAVARPVWSVVWSVSIVFIHASVIGVSATWSAQFAPSGAACAEEIIQCRVMYPQDHWSFGCCCPMVNCL